MQPHADVSAALAGAGHVVVRGAFSSGWLERVAANTAAIPTITGALAEPELLDNTHVAPILAAVLGEGYIMGRLTLGTAVSGVLARLPAHADLFGDARHDARMPAIGLVVLIAVTPSSVHVVPGPHHAGRATTGTTLALAAGDCLISDTRLVLKAEPSDGMALVCVYYRHWFREPVAPVDAPPVSISIVTYGRLPRSQRQLFSWRFDRYLKLRPRLLLDRGVRRLPPALIGVVQRLLPRRRP